MPIKNGFLSGLTGLVNINSTFNNTIITISTKDGNNLCWSSAGNVGFKGTRKSKSFAAQLAAEKVALKARRIGIRTLDILIKGRGAGRQSALRAIEIVGFHINSIKDITGLPHNGCRRPKKRRI